MRAKADYKLCTFKILELPRKMLGRWLLRRSNSVTFFGPSPSKRLSEQRCVYVLRTCGLARIMIAYRNVMMVMQTRHGRICRDGSERWNE